MDEKLKKEIEHIVSSIFANKTEEKKRQKTEDALKLSAEKVENLTKENSELSKSIEDYKTTIDELESKLEALEVEKSTIIEAKDKEISELTEAKEALTSEMEEVSKELSSIRKELAADKRMCELDEAGVAREDKESQRAKVSEMSDEEFASYKEELVAVREYVIATLESSTKDSENASEDEESDDTTPPANIDPNQSTQAALNMESLPSDDLLDKYKELGNAMAEALTQNN